MRQPRDEAFELVRSLVEAVVLTPVDGRMSIERRGALAGILALCDAGKTKPGTFAGTGSAAQMKMVTGAGFGIYRTPSQASRD